MEDMMQERILTVINYDDDGEMVRLTLAPHLVKAIIAGNDDVEFHGHLLRKTKILFHDSEDIELHISMADLSTLERAIGNYYLES